MNKQKYKMKNKTKSILVTVGMILLIFAVVAGAYLLLKNHNDSKQREGFELCEVTWKTNGIDLTTGNMVIDEGYMYSSEIKVTSTLKIERDFVSGISYVVCYYNELGELLYADTNEESDSETFKGYTKNYNKNVSEIEVEEGETIDHARIVVKWLEDDNDEISFFERLKLQNKINVYVASQSESDTVTEETTDTTTTEE